MGKQTLVFKETFFKEGNIELSVGGFVIESFDGFRNEVYLLSEVGDYQALLDKMPDEKRDGEVIYCDDFETAMLRNFKLGEIVLEELLKHPNIIEKYAMICREVAKHIDEGYTDIAVAVRTVTVTPPTQPGAMFSAN